MSDLSNTQLGKYRLQSRLGAGGMGAVYRSQHPQLNIPVAIKIIQGSVTDEARQRFLREAQMAAKLSHPNIVRVFDVDEHEGNPYIVMELIEGPSLVEVLQQGRIPLERVLEISIQLAEALDYAHNAGMLHRDLKPANVLLRPNGQLVLVDFGLARMAMGDSDQITQSGMIIGTIGYMAPEQLQASKLDHRTDIYAFGVILFQMVTGRHPFPGDTAQMMYSHVYVPAPLPSSTGALLPPALDNLINVMLAKNPNDRPQTAGEIARVLRAVQANATVPPAYPAYVGATVQQPLAPALGHVPSATPSQPFQPPYTGPTVGGFGPPSQPLAPTMAVGQPNNNRLLWGVIGSVTLLILVIIGGTFLLLNQRKPTVVQVPPPNNDKGPLQIPLGDPNLRLPTIVAQPDDRPRPTARPTQPKAPPTAPARTPQPIKNTIPELELIPATEDDSSEGEFAISGLYRRLPTDVNESTWFYGLVTNQTERDYNSVKITVVLKDSTGKVVAKQDGYTQAGYLAPGQSAGWQALFSEALPEYTSYTIQVDGQSSGFLTDDFYKRNFTVSEVTLIPEGDSIFPSIEGQITNNEEHPVKLVQAKITFFNAENQVIDLETAIPKSTELQPGQTTRFETSILGAKSSLIDHYEILVEGTKDDE